MFWEKELTRLAKRCRELALDCALDREQVTEAAGALARRFAWVSAAQALYTRYRPFFVIGLPLAGLFLGKRLPRLARWSALAAPLLRLGRGLLPLFRSARS